MSPESDHREPHEPERHEETSRSEESSGVLRPQDEGWEETPAEEIVTDDAPGDQVSDVSQGLQEQVEESRTKTRRQFGTFGGVFTPTLLTILGVIMFLRLGWVVGNAGIFGSALIILVAFGITTLTGLAMSSIVTNIRIGAGGAYAIISQSLGLEIGGALGIPRYLSQALAVTMYIFGLRAGWVWVFPDHHPFLVDLIAFLVLWGIAYKSADLAIRVQFVIMVVIGAALVSIGIAAFQGSMQYPAEHVSLWGSYRGAPETGFQGSSFWMVFAVFFPAATGIMAGANMSGDLKDPKRSIPLGTLAAIGVSLVIYLVLAYWLARSATVDELTSNYTVMVDKAFWGPAVIAGLLGATFSSALASMVGSGRILQAMGEHRVVPSSRWLARLTPEGEPRNAMIVTGGIIFATILLRELNVVAPLITMFFLLTYAMICAVVLIEQSLNLVSFRPLLRVSRWVSFLGMASSLVAMFILHPAFSLLAVVLTVLVYGILTRRRLRAPFGDVRSGLFVALAEWAAKHVKESPAATERSWRPNLLVPVEDPTDLRGAFHLIRDVAHPQGSVKLVGLSTLQLHDRLEDRLPTFTRALRKEGVFTTWTLLETESYADGVLTTVQALGGAFFRPNILFLAMPRPEFGSDEAIASRRADLTRIIDYARDVRGTGVVLMKQHDRAGLGRRQWIHVWIRDQSPNWELSMELGDVDLALLVGYQLLQDWKGGMRVLTAVREPENVEPAREYLEDLVELSRIPSTEVMVLEGDLDRGLEDAPQGDVSIFGIPDPPDLDFVDRMADATRTTCLFVRDSGEENVLA